MKERITKDNFQTRVQIDPETGCWLWQLYLHPKTGYGVCKVNQKTYFAHRLAFTLFVGPIPEGLQVNHICDVKRCVNPAHLYAGTQAQNVRDAVERNRWPIGDKSGARRHPESMCWSENHAFRTNPNRIPRGEKRGQTKLTTEAVIAIRALAAQGIPQAELARQYLVSVQTINNVVHRKKWKHI